MFYPKIDHSDPDADANGDGVSNYQEMILLKDPYRDPHAFRPELLERLFASKSRHKLTPEQVAAHKEAVFAARREHIAPLQNQGVLGRDGNPISLTTLRQEKRSRLADLIDKLKGNTKERQARIGEWKRKNPDSEQPDDVIDGSPIYKRGFNHAAAVTVGTAHLWPNGTVGADQDGQGSEFAMWDVGGVRLSHEGLAGRVTQSLSDPQTPVNDPHATGVAGVLIGGGAPGVSIPGPNSVPDENTDPLGYNREKARGMSYKSTLLVYDRNNDVAEMATAVATHDLRLSNHSYGTESGWEKTPIGSWKWNGNTSIPPNPSILQNDPTADSKFGKYLAGTSDSIDLIVYLSDTYLPVFAAGNDQLEGPAEADQPVPHVALSNNLLKFYDHDPANGIYGVTRPLDGRWKFTGINVARDCLSPEASSKNVLTVSGSYQIPGHGRADGSIGATNDGRMKPDIQAPTSVFTSGASSDTSYAQLDGTSASTAIVTGSLNLIRESYKELRGDTHPMLASTLKGIAIASTGSPFERFQLGDPADYGFYWGWGEFDAERGGETVLADSEPAVADAHPHIKEVVMSNESIPNNRRIVQFPVKYTSEGGDLDITICWSDPPGDGVALNVDDSGSRLKNKLDLLVWPPGVVPFSNGSTPISPIKFFTDDSSYGGQTLGVNLLDNVERVINSRNNPSYGSGTYTVTITKDGLLRDEQGFPAPQAVSIIIQGNEAQPSQFAITEILELGNNQYAIYWNSDVGALYQVESSTDLKSWFVEVDTNQNPIDISPTNTQTVYVITATPGVPREYYRIRQTK